MKIFRRTYQTSMKEKEPMQFVVKEGELHLLKIFYYYTIQDTRIPTDTPSLESNTNNCTRLRS